MLVLNASFYVYLILVANTQLYQTYIHILFY